MKMKLTEIMIRKKIIQVDESEVFEYGIELATLKLFHSLIVILVGFIFNKPLETIFFILFYEILKANINSYHSKSKIICYCLSILMAIGLIFLTSFLDDFTPSYLSDISILFLVAFYIILSQNSERKKYVILVSILSIILYSIFRYFDFPSLIITMFYGLILSEFLSILDKSISN